jgi:hypothetical protein
MIQLLHRSIEFPRMNFKLRSLFLFVTFAAVTCAVAAASYKARDWSGVSMLGRLMVSFVGGAMVATLPVLVIWLALGRGRSR